MAASVIEKAESALRERALSFPQTNEEFPWGERAIKVRGKAFIFMYGAGGELKLSLKLPDSGNAALLLPFCEPTHYGLGKSGWVTAKFDKKISPPLALLYEWLEESYRAVAPKRIAVQLAGAPAAGAAQPPAARASRRKPAPKKPARKAGGKSPRTAKKPR